MVASRSEGVARRFGEVDVQRESEKIHSKSKSSKVHKMKMTKYQSVHGHVLRASKVILLHRYIQSTTCY